MCFSATASFISGTALCVIGIATLKQTQASVEVPFALIPLLFGIQQLTEGVIYLHFRFRDSGWGQSDMQVLPDASKAHPE